MIGPSRAVVECPAGCPALVGLEVTRSGRARGGGGTAVCRGRVSASARRSPPRSPTRLSPPGRRLAWRVPSWAGAMMQVRRARVQLRLDLAESPAPAAVLWELVGEEERQAAMALLAALIAKTVADDPEEAAACE